MNLQTLNISVKDPDGVAVFAKVTFTPIATSPVVNGSNLITQIPVSTLTNDFGIGSISLVTGCYVVALEGIEGSLGSRRISIPNDGGTYDLSALVDANSSEGQVYTFIVNGPASGLTGLVGGPNRLDSVPTVGAESLCWLVYDPSIFPIPRFWFLRAGAESVSDPTNGIVIPLDHATSGKVWISIS